MTKSSNYYDIYVYIYIYDIVDRPMAPNCSSATSSLSTISSSRNQGYIIHKSEGVNGPKKTLTGSGPLSVSFNQFVGPIRS